MKIIEPKCLIILLFFIQGCLFAGEGIFIEEEVTVPPVFGLPRQTHSTRTWMTSTRLRRDEGNRHQTLLIDTEKKQGWLVQHRDSTIMEMDMATFQGLALMTMMMFGVTYDTLTGEPIIPDSIFFKSGRKGKIGDWLSEEIIVHHRQKNSSQGNRRPVVMWITADTSINQPVYAILLRSMMGPLAEQYASFFNQLERLGGYPAELSAWALGMEIHQKLKRLEKQGNYVATGYLRTGEL